MLGAKTSGFVCLLHRSDHRDVPNHPRLAALPVISFVWPGVCGSGLRLQVDLTCFLCPNCVSIYPNRLVMAAADGDQVTQQTPVVSNHLVGPCRQTGWAMLTLCGVGLDSLGRVLGRAFFFGAFDEYL